MGAVGDPGLADACSSPVTGGAPLTRDSAPRGERHTPPSREVALGTPSQGPIRVPDPGAFLQPPSGTAGWSARVAKQAGRGVGGGPAGATGRASCPEGWAARSRGAASGAPGSLDGAHPLTQVQAACLGRSWKDRRAERRGGFRFLIRHRLVTLLCPLRDSNSWSRGPGRAAWTAAHEPRAQRSAWGVRSAEMRLVSRLLPSGTDRRLPFPAERVGPRCQI